MQDGVIGRGQLLDLGLTPAQAPQHWERSLADPASRCLRDLHRAGRSGGPRVGRSSVRGVGAVASHRTALWLAGMFDQLTDPIHVSVPANRRVQSQPGIRIHLSRRLESDPGLLVHPSSNVPRQRVEVALLEHCQRESAEQAAHLVLSGIQRRLTTASRLRSALDAMARHRWRRLIHDVLDETAKGVASPLELSYRRMVELPHRLPDGVRNLHERVPSGASIYRDIRYLQWRVIVELDGREAHPADQAFRDLRRDNLAVVGGDATMRYGWRDVVGNPCAVASQVGQVLTTQGWRGRLNPCSAACTAF